MSSDNKNFDGNRKAFSCLDLFEMLQSYNFRYTIADRAEWMERILSPDDLQCLAQVKRKCHRIEDLEWNSKYIIQVAAHTEGADWGPWSDKLEATTTQASGFSLKFMKKVSARNNFRIGLAKNDIQI